MRPHLIRILSLLLLSVGLASCGDDAAPGNPSGAIKGQIGFSMKSASNPFFKIIADNLAEAAAEHGYEVLIASGDEDVRIQAGQIDDWITKQVAAIVLNPVDSKTIGPAIRKANEAGIPVFTCDLRCTDPEAKVVTHIATDNFQGGRLAGTAMVGLLGETGGQVLVLDLPSAASCVLRVQGFQQVVDEHNAAHDDKQIVVVAKFGSKGQKERGYAITMDALEQHPEIDAIFAINDPAALGAYQALVKADRTNEIQIIGFDGQLEAKQAIKDGKIFADPIQFPDRMGRMTMAAILRFFAGEELAEQTLIPSELYGKKQADADPLLR